MQAGGFILEGNGDFGVLLLHGFTANAQQMGELAQRLHERGFTVSAPMLPGHGGAPEDMENVTWRDWLACVRQEYTSLRQKYARVAAMSCWICTPSASGEGKRRSSRRNRRNSRRTCDP